MLAGRGVAVVADCDAIVIDSKDLREHERGARFSRDRRNCWVGNRDARQHSIDGGPERSGEPMDLSVQTDVKAHDEAVVVDALRVDDVRTRGGVDCDETLTRVIGEEEPPALPARR